MDADTPADPPTVTEEWARLSEGLQLRLAQDAMRQATRAVARQAELLALEIERGVIADRGGADALLLFAELLRAASTGPAPADAGKPAAPASGAAPATPPASRATGWHSGRA